MPVGPLIIAGVTGMLFTFTESVFAKLAPQVLFAVTLIIPVEPTPGVAVIPAIVDEPDHPEPVVGNVHV